MDSMKHEIHGNQYPKVIITIYSCHIYVLVPCQDMDFPQLLSLYLCLDIFEVVLVVVVGYIVILH